MAILEVRGLTKDFGGLRVLDDCSFKVKEGSLHTVVGPNGAGKTTLFNLISGFLRPSSGEILYKGSDITKIPPYKMAHLGMCRSFQVLTVFYGLSVLENVRLAIQSTSGRNFNFFRRALEIREMVEEAYHVLELVGLSSDADRIASELSHGQQRYLDIAMAVAGRGELLLLDEPTSGLVHDEIPQMGKTIRALTPKMTVLLIEHRIEMVLAISDWITVLDYGRVIAEGPPDVVRQNEEVSRAYLGKA